MCTDDPSTAMGAQEQLSRVDRTAVISMLEGFEQSSWLPIDDAHSSHCVACYHRKDSVAVREADLNARHRRASKWLVLNAAVVVVLFASSLNR
jgi:hypothetical protein